jgi:hypothetical protein
VSQFGNAPNGPLVVHDIQAGGGKRGCCDGGGVVARRRLSTGHLH